MPQQAWSEKRERQYEHIKEGLTERGRDEDVAEEIAARTVNKERARAGEARQASKTSTDDISSSRRGGLRSHSGAARPDQGPALRGGAGQEHQGARVDDRGPAGARRRPIARQVVGTSPVSMTSAAMSRSLRCRCWLAVFNISKA